MPRKTTPLKKIDFLQKFFVESLFCVGSIFILISMTYAFHIRDKLEENISFVMARTKPVLWETSQTAVVLASSKDEELNLFQKIKVYEPKTIYSIKTFDMEQDPHINPARRFLTPVFEKLEQEEDFFNLKGKIVFIGTKEEKNILENISLFYNQKITNCLLKTIPIGWTIFQVVFFSLLYFFLWNNSSFFAFLCFFVLSSSLLILKGTLQTYGSIYLPLADTFIFSFFATLMGAFKKSYLSHRWILKEKHEIYIQQQLTELQNKFFHRFCEDVYDKNVSMISKLKTLDASLYAYDMFQKTKHASEDLQDYLLGLKKISEIERQSFHKISIQKVLIKKTVEKILLQFEQDIEKKELQMILNIKDDLFFLTDEFLFESLLFNLISNAVKYSYSKKMINITAQLESQKKLLISVEDQGPGIPEHLQAMIFEKFYRIQNDQNYGIKGYGLGLYFCQFFAKMLGAKITLSSQDGLGSKFFLVLET